MSQSKAPDDGDEADANSDEIGRSIIDSIVDQTATITLEDSKAALPHHPTDPEMNAYTKSSTNRNIVFHPEHPEKIYDLSSTSTTSTARSSSAQVDPAPNDLPIPKKDTAGRPNAHHKKDTAKAPPANDENARTASAAHHRGGGPATKSKASAAAAAPPTAHGHSSAAGAAPEANGASPSKKPSSSSSSLTREERRERKRKLEDPNCFPKRFEVQVQARVRVDRELTSHYLTDLPEGSVVTVEEIVDRRARISRPLCGWLSVTSKFGARIILPTNSKYSKIGGKVIFKRPTANGATAKVIDFNDERNLYKVRYDDGNTQWIDIEDQNIQFVSQHKAVKVQKPLDGTAPTFTLQTSQAFFNQFFCKDYPQYQAQSSSTTRHMDISPVAVHGTQFGRYPPPAGPPNAPRVGQYPPAGYPRNAPHGQYPHGQPGGPYPAGQPPGPYPPYGPGQGDPRSHVPPPNGRPVPHQGMLPNSPYQNHHAPPGPLPSRPPPQPPNVINGGKKPDGATDAKHQEFNKKVKEIERRIIQHLHQRGYDESHPDYHRYLAKAKELAIQKAGKEREKLLAAQRDRQQNFTRHEYQKYMRYREQQQQKHAIAEQQRKKRLAQEAQERQERAAAQARKEGKTPPKPSNNAVKGLIVLRGLPGSGKTTLAKKLSQRSKHARICTEDRYHWSGKEDGVGEYKFQPQLVFLAREWCTKEIRECIQQNVNLIILDNHNARISMYEDHIQFAVEHGYRFRIIEFVASASLIDKYRARSYKKFPREVYVKLLKLWEHDPRTELINPTFGDPTPGPKPEGADNGNGGGPHTAGGDAAKNGNENDDESTQPPKPR